MTMRMAPDTLRDEISQVNSILEKWIKTLNNGVPGDEIPSNDLNIDKFRYQLRGEITLAAERLTAVAEVLES